MIGISTDMSSLAQDISLGKLLVSEAAPRELQLIAARFCLKGALMPSGAQLLASKAAPWYRKAFCYTILPRGCFQPTPFFISSEKRRVHCYLPPS